MLWIRITLMQIRIRLIYHPDADPDSYFFLCGSRSGFLFYADPDPDLTFHPDADPDLDTDPNFQIKLQTLEKVHK
jgi:hypothetical protein